MEETRNMQAEEKEESQNGKAGTEELKEQLKARLEEMRERGKEADEAIRQGRGRMQLEKPIKAGGEELTELVYDFTELTGLDYTTAMDSDVNAQQLYRMSYRQGLALFAAAAAKQTKLADARDIVERIGVTDAVEGVYLATLFFTASARAGRLRISKM